MQTYRTMLAAHLVKLGRMPAAIRDAGEASASGSLGLPDAATCMLGPSAPPSPPPQHPPTDEGDRPPSDGDATDEAGELDVALDPARPALHGAREASRARERALVAMRCRHNRRSAHALRARLVTAQPIYERLASIRDVDPTVDVAVWLPKVAAAVESKRTLARCGIDSSSSSSPSSQGEEEGDTAPRWKRRRGERARQRARQRVAHGEGGGEGGEEGEEEDGASARRFARRHGRVRRRVEAFLTACLEECSHAQSLGGAPARAMVQRAAAKVMARHPRDTEGAFIAREESSMRRLILQYAEREKTHTNRVTGE